MGQLETFSFFLVIFCGEFAQGSDSFGKASQTAPKLTVTLAVALEGILTWPTLKCVCVELNEALLARQMECHSTFSGML